MVQGLSVAEQSARDRIFRDEGALAFTHRPGALPGREAEHARLITLGRGFVLSGVPAHVVINGPVGSGKSATAVAAAEMLRQEAGRGRGRGLHVVVVNCRLRNRAHDVAVRLVQSIVPPFPDRGFSIAEMLDALVKQLSRKGANLFVVLDEAQELLKDKDDGVMLLNLLTRMGAEDAVQGVRCMVWLVAQTENRGHLDASTLSTFGRARTLLFEPYAFETMLHIVQVRAQEALAAGVLEEDAARSIAARAVRHQDVRYAIELLHVAACQAIEWNETRIVVDTVRAACGEKPLQPRRGGIVMVPAHVEAPVKHEEPATATRILRDVAKGATPERIRIWEEFQKAGPCSITDVMRKLGVSRRGTAFHVAALDAEGHLRFAARGQRGEMVYEAVGTTPPPVAARLVTADLVLQTFRELAPTSGTRVARALGRTQPTIMNHLRKLILQGELVRVGQHKREVLYGPPGTQMVVPVEVPGAKPRAQERTFVALSEHGGMTVKQVATLLRVPYQSIYTHVRVLEKEGRIRRRAHGPGSTVVYEVVSA